MRSGRALVLSLRRIIGKGGWLELWPAGRDYEIINRHYLVTAADLEPEALRQERLRHFPDLRQVGSRVPRRANLDCE